MNLYNYGSHHISKNDIEIVKKTLLNGTLTQGNLVGVFEKKLSQYFGSKYTTVFSNGSSALIALGKALNWSKNDLIITTPITFVASSNCALHLGAKVDFVDIDPITINISCQHLEDKIKNIRKKNIKNNLSVIAVDFAGLPCDWNNLRYLANKYSFTLINDNCHALGAKYYGSRKYAVQYADAVTQSYHPVKNFTTGEGGSVLVNDKNLDTKLKEIRDHGIKRDNFKKKQPLWYYEMNKLGFNFRLNEISCALGISQLKSLNKYIDKREKIAKFYSKIFSNHNLKLPFSDKNSQTSNHIFYLRYNFPNLQSKNTFFDKLLNKNIKLQVHYIPVYKHPFYKKILANDFQLANAEQYYHETFSIPMHYKLNQKDLEYISKSILDSL